ncbi:MAG: peptide chain release factor N(5)-glutamine methyltransferase [Spirochaetaceae bacterium]|nr:peptide chain release factor N(5)-glutamine methyltransferase [Spirochaetaceae bacterium]
MFLKDILIEAGRQLKAISDSPQLDAGLLLAHTLKLNRTQLYSLPSDYRLCDEQLDSYQKLIKKRLTGYPVAYLINNREFYGRNFFIKKGVLIPRPDSEILIETVLALYRKQPFKTLRDVGTGSGCLAITLALELGEAVLVTASDISSIAAEVFAVNNQNLTGGKVAFKEVSLLEDDESYDVIIANLPYLTTEETNEKLAEQWQEPALALDGGGDGLILIAKLIKQAQGKTSAIILEADPRQMAAINKLLIAAGFNHTHTERDLAGDERIIIGKINN